MGWIEVLVYREDRRIVELDAGRDRVTPAPGGDEEASADRARAQGAPSPSTAPSPENEVAQAPRAEASFPGTGWGPRAADPVVVVDFEPERRPAERVTLRYEYRDSLIVLGVLPRPPQAGDRLGQRERGNRGFAEAPPR
jgi:hypothetical protein